MVFKDYEEMYMAYENKMVGLHSNVKVRRRLNDEDRGKLVDGTVGQFIFNENIPQDIGFVDRSKDAYGLEIDFLCTKKKLGVIIDKCFRRHGNTVTALMLDHIKEVGFKYSTKGAISVSITDMEIPDEKAALIKKAEIEVEKHLKAYRRGMISDEERYSKVIETWKRTTEDVTEALMNNLGRMNNIQIMLHSGAMGSKNQIRQLAGMRGLIANTTGKIVEIPIKSNFREGLSVLEYFMSTSEVGKELVDTAYRTADSDQLTRCLVDVSHDVIVREEDCGATTGVEMVAFKSGKTGLEMIEPLYDRIIGRYSIEDINHPKTGERIVSVGEMITPDMGKMIVESGIEKVVVRSVLHCKAEHGVCAKCYGLNLATGKPVNIGEAVGIIAAQSIGESGTQLTMRTFHTGGVAGADITQGLPRVEELFEAKKPKGMAVVSEIEGKVTMSVK